MKSFPTNTECIHTKICIPTNTIVIDVCTPYEPPTFLYNSDHLKSIGVRQRKWMVGAAYAGEGGIVVGGIQKPPRMLCCSPSSNRSRSSVVSNFATEHAWPY